MDDQQSYKSPKKIFDLIKEGINKITQEEKIKKRQAEYLIIQLEDLLDKMAKNAQKKANLSEIQGFDTEIDLWYSNRRNKSTWLEYRIIASIYSENDVIGCYLNSQDLPYRVICTYSGGAFVLFDPPQSIFFIEDTKHSILNIYNILNPGVLTDMGKQYIHIETDVSKRFNKPIEENPEIRIYSNKFIYDNRRYNMKMTWHFYNLF
jgi:hypothetical protein